METIDEWQSRYGRDLGVILDIDHIDHKEVRLLTGSKQTWLSRPDVVRLIAALQQALTKLPTP